MTPNLTPDNCICVENPQDEKYLLADPGCPVHGTPKLTPETLREQADDTIGVCDCGFRGFYEPLAHQPTCGYRVILLCADAWEADRQRMEALECLQPEARRLIRVLDNAVPNPGWRARILVVLSALAKSEEAT